MLNDEYVRQKELLKTYEDQVIYSIAIDQLGTMDLRIGKRSSQLDEFLLEKLGFEDGYIITAYNPMGQKQSAGVNETAHRDLTSHLQEQKKIVFLPSCNYGKSSNSEKDWIEPGYAVFGLNFEQALAIARCFNQLAIVRLHRGHPPELIKTGC